MEHTFNVLFHYLYEYTLFTLKPTCITHDSYTELHTYVMYIMCIDQLNTTMQASVKSTPYELVFGQPPRKTVFPGVTNSTAMEEDVLDIVEEGSYLHM